ncbi:MAG: hypothetical protein Q9O24_06080 [Gammaproteobacteria bacterium]|nr:hypothetical protein [Gammaproteobacteria bacterium]
MTLKKIFYIPLSIFLFGLSALASAVAEHGARDPHPQQVDPVGHEIFFNAAGLYLIQLQNDDVLVVQADAILDKKVWEKASGGKHDHYNLFAKDKNYICQLISQKEKQDAVDKMLTDYSQQVKTVFDQRRKAATEKKIANQELPKQGLKDSSARVVSMSIHTWSG